MKRTLLTVAVVLITCFRTVADSLDDYVAFCKAEFKFAFCGVDDSISAFRVPISQKYVETQFFSRYNLRGLRKIQYDHIVQFELATASKKNYLLALSNLVVDVELAFMNKDAGPGYKSNFLYLIEMVECSIARINEANGDVCVSPQDVDKLLPLKLFNHYGGNVSAIRCYGMMRDLLIIGAHISTYKKVAGHIPLSIGDMDILEEPAIKNKYVEYIKEGEAWQLVASPKKINAMLIVFDKYVPLIMGQPERFWKFETCVMLSSSFSKKRKDLYKGEILNEGTPWACRMDGGKVIPYAITHSK